MAGTKEIIVYLGCGVAIIGPLIEALITITGQFHYMDHTLFIMPVWLPFIYINSVLIAANFDIFLENRS